MRMQSRLLQEIATERRKTNGKGPRCLCRSLLRWWLRRQGLELLLGASMLGFLALGFGVCSVNSACGELTVSIPPVTEIFLHRKVVVVLPVLHLHCRFLLFHPHGLLQSNRMERCLKLRYLVETLPQMQIHLRHVLFLVHRIEFGKHWIFGNWNHPPSRSPAVASL